MVGWWLVVSPAGAADLDELVVAWTQVVQGQGGSDGADRANGVALDSVGNVVAVGWLDGLADHGADGYAVQYGADGALGWEIVLDAGPIGDERPTSDDRFFAAAFEPLFDDLVLCGRSGASTPTDPAGRYHLQTRGFGLPPALVWDFDAIDGTSVQQECRGVVWANGFVYATGWSEHGPDFGRWVTYKLDGADSQVVYPPQFVDSGDYEGVPDMAHAVGLHIASGKYTIVGELGIAGLPGSLRNDTDWHVRSFDDSYGLPVLLWEHTLDGGNLLEDRAEAVAIEPISGDVFVAGSMQYGDDNGPASDRDWFVARYDKDGDGYGGPLMIWQQTFESVPGADERATAIQIDDLGDVLVAGTVVDPKTGVDTWRVARLAGYDGLELQSWVGTTYAGDSVPRAMSFRSDKIAIAGSIDDGAGEDFAVTVLEGDGDDDGWADSVDACPDDPDKSVDTGICGCNVPDIDSDSDGLENCLDGCEQDPEKTEPGICGCHEEDKDRDYDGTYDCDDHCPDDEDKIEWGICGCNVADADSDGDGVVGCDDACSNTPAGEPVDDFGCPLTDGGEETGDTGSTGDDDAAKDNSCGCGASPAPLAALPLLAVMVGARRRRR